MNPLPEVVRSYFDATNEQDVDGVLDCFAESAAVFDIGESMEMHGAEQIGDWLTGTISRYKLTTEVEKVRQQGEELVVGALVSGDFPGSPLKFDYEFRVKNNKIERLVIKAVR